MTDEALFIALASFVLVDVRPDDILVCAGFHLDRLEIGYSTRKRTYDTFAA